jgi:hypothetical protein
MDIYLDECGALPLANDTPNIDMIGIFIPLKHWRELAAYGLTVYGITAYRPRIEVNNIFFFRYMEREAFLS